MYILFINTKMSELPFDGGYLSSGFKHNQPICVLQHFRSPGQSESHLHLSTESPARVFLHQRRRTFSIELTKIFHIKRRKNVKNLSTLYTRIIAQLHVEFMNTVSLSSRIAQEGNDLCFHWLVMIDVCAYNVDNATEAKFLCQGCVQYKNGVSYISKMVVLFEIILPKAAFNFVFVYRRVTQCSANRYTSTSTGPVYERDFLAKKLNIVEARFISLCVRACDRSCSTGFGNNLHCQPACIHASSAHFELYHTKNTLYKIYCDVKYNCCEWTTSRLIIDKGDNVDPGWDKRRDKCQHPKYIIEHMPLCSSDFLSLYCAIIRAVRFSGRVVDSRSRVRLALVSHWSTHFLFLGHGRAVFLFHDSSFRADVLLCVFVLSWFSVFHELTDICETPRLSTFHPFPSNRVSFIDTR
ncbi:hypothetical protein T4B_330 [Trichinella pseudospiralis]|uniref:Uncharacterized protein n=1 Tax=Trichinella pseudospiralis TaxID=6337 RepID=A0A0V1J3C3_TRIPS|nr:hypothetical protein T4A_13018 [Trichinella pseudospiralis]KRZ29466.1 hypothetical protein T4B_330 [Trichinella pseudospiralis]KRZ43587.1 hypothetical protein T4C_2404 [Trichinella pseudospiralis]